MTLESLRLLTYDDMVKILGLSKGALYGMVHRNAIPHMRLTGRIVRFHPEEIERWLTANGLRLDEVGAGLAEVHHDER